jgi:hypothetical protein
VARFGYKTGLRASQQREIGPGGRPSSLCVSNSHTLAYSSSDCSSKLPKNRSRSSNAVCGAIAEMNRIRLVLFDMNSRILNPIWMPKNRSRSSNTVCGAITEMNRTRLVLFDMNNRIFGPYLGCGTKSDSAHEVRCATLDRTNTYFRVGHLDPVGPEVLSVVSAGQTRLTPQHSRGAITERRVLLLVIE